MKNKTIIQALMLLTIDDIRRQQSEPPLIKPPFPEPTKRQAQLVELGFTSCSEVEDYRQRKRQYDIVLMRYKCDVYKREQFNRFIKRMKKVKDIYGKKALLVPQEIFKNFCQGKGLVAGCFEDYTGDIPQWALDEIERLTHKSTPTFVKKLTSQEILDVAGKRAEREPIFFGLADLASDHHKSRYAYFIVAPSSMMRKRTPTLDKDPMICALCDEGVIILTRWGEEENDETIHCYEKINDLLKNK